MTRTELISETSAIAAVSLSFRATCIQVICRGMSVRKVNTKPRI
jgi:hypothetical protein